MENGKYVVRKVRLLKHGRYRVYLEGIRFKSFIVKDPTIRQFSIVNLVDGKVSK